ncbi:hypothetical protein NEPAR06_1212 [Nematocida parisii]|uniref:Uncharacterized protein n=1 Tax=Nematocida parisii (strain ERTm3) TaxID=935791 RepID=I3EK45_NEMP3|nr:uncharacterized protein NEPG_00873 [Nematocida parisii ERTm1]EIJ89592.1 hypothetical protein NEQG_00362 [Nematocida parisii ERTm3]KAI5128623.1 hypothetical protein NEPAR08_1334 [Nematocida parisii]KAI5165823.1 hypothetical protein NEIRO02_0721 [Nematocida sp. AWRm79]KAI5183956.1 hypothetical protein NEIRO03_1429 [Nematocida sp. AWRm78]OAG32217.1 hypothetical protein NEIG_01902 [Nematocida sp. ERTm5]|eukprot:XP_013058702.1 hypothetical protein NEPG_00873 [Nematocida parisii ERTm1]
MEEIKVDRPLNPIKDILIFEKQLNNKYIHETKRRFIYFVVLMIMVCSYVLYINRKMYNILWDVYSRDSIYLTGLVFKIYLKTIGVIMLQGYVFIRLLRRSSTVTNSLTEQLKLLNIFFNNQKLSLCEIKTPRNIKIAINTFRDEEQKKKAQWMKKE